MEIKRDELVACLRRIAPTLGDKTPIEQLKCFWFDGGNSRAWTYDEVVATEAPFAGDLSGGVGAQLLGLVENSSAENVEIEVAGPELRLKAGGTKGKLGVRGMDEKIYPFPDGDAEPGVFVTLSKDMAAALRHVCANAQQSGVTLVAEDGRLSFYSTDNKSISWARMPLQEGYDAPRLLLSPQFCERLQACIVGDQDMLEIMGDRVVATFADDVRLFGRLTAEEHPRPFRDAISNAVPEDGRLDVPEGMAEALRRVQVLVVPGKQDLMRVSLSGADLRIEFASDLGQIDERLKVKGNKRSLDAHFDPELLKTGFSFMTPTAIFLGERALAFVDEREFGYVMSASPRPE